MVHFLSKEKFMTNFGFTMAMDMRMRMMCVMCRFRVAEKS